MTRSVLALLLLIALATAGCSSDDGSNEMPASCDFSSGPRECPPTSFFCPDANEPQTYTVPAGVTGILVDARGAYGAQPFNAGANQVLGGLGGAGGRVITPLQVSPGDQLKIYVGCAASGRDGGWGHGSGGKGGTGGRWGVDGGGGGGSSAIVDADGTVLVVAGGGGGGGGNENDGSGPTDAQVGTWGGDGGFGTSPPTEGAPGQCNGVGCVIAYGGCAACSGGLDGGDGDSLSNASDFGGGGGGGGGGYIAGNGGQHATVDLFAEGAAAGNNPCHGNCPIDVGEAGGGGGGQSYAISDDAIFLPNVYGPAGEVIIHTTSAGVQLVPCDPDAPAAQITVPPGATRFDIELVGGSGHTPDWGDKYRPVSANGQGGFGGVVTATIPVGDGGVEVGDTLVLLPGCQGQGTGGSGWGMGGDHGTSSDDQGQDGGGGGGGSAVADSDLSQPIAVAGGGGGGGGSQLGAGGAGGDGGPINSTDGNPGASADGDGGSGGCEGCNDSKMPFDGTHGHHADLGGGGGGGGGGWPGGGGGGAGHGGGGGGGAGGVSAFDSDYTTNANIDISNAPGDGYVLISLYPAPPANIVAVSGSGQDVAVGATFPQPLVVQVTDILNVPIAGATVNFTLSGTGAASGTFPDGTQNAPVITDSNGIAKSPAVTAAVMPGTWEAGAYVEGLDEIATFALTNAGVSTTIELSVAPQPVTPNQVTSITAAVIPDHPDVTPAGSITITVQGAPFDYPLVDGKAVVQFDPGDLELGSSTIEAHYAGGGMIGGSSASLPLDVVETPTSMRLSSSANPSAPGQDVVFTATITVPEGTVSCSACVVTFYVDDTFLDTVEVDANWQASSPPATGLAAGVHTVHAEFSGGTYASSSATMPQSVGLTLVLGTNTATNYYGADLVLVATVAAPDGPAPTGTVTFETGSGEVRCAGVPLAQLHAACDLGNALAAGRYDFVAHYSGDGNYPAVSGSLQLAVQPTRTTVTVDAPARVTPEGQPFKISAAVARIEPGTLPLSGTVQFYLDGETFGDPVPIDAGGSTSLMEVSVLPGTHVLSATYSGTPDGYLGSEGQKTIEVLGSDS